MRDDELNDLSILPDQTNEPKKPPYSIPSLLNINNQPNLTSIGACFPNGSSDLAGCEVGTGAGGYCAVGNGV